MSFNCEPDKFKLEDKVVFIYSKREYHKSKVNNNFFEKQYELLQRLEIKGGFKIIRIE